ncbi:MAG TPA: hypothetical protein VLN74_07765 [Ilumatobacteraceae bacterium]|nr:hypothetical protein [Ilumatobacteraceae bacterium]
MLGIVFESVERTSRGSSGIGPVVMVVGLTIASALVLSWVSHRLPGSNENTGASPFSRGRRRNPFDQPPEDTTDRSPNTPFDR